MKIYIRSSACISAQKTFGRAGFSEEPVEYTGNRLPIIEPEYADLIDPKLIRRMSRIIRMGVAAAQECLRAGNVKMPGAVITGTAYGCLEDTISFLTRMIEGKEEMLPPTAFIQSTHNTVAAQIALMLKCHAYNNTFVHKGISFESALQDAAMLLMEKEADNILVGGSDEMTDASFTILSRLGLYKREPVSNLSLFTTNSKGTIGGEGAAFFLLTDKQAGDNLAELTGTQTFYRPGSNDEIDRKIISFLNLYQLNPNDIDLFITGKNGDLKNDEVYSRLSQSIFKNTPIANFKHLCGEYPTSSAFALWLAAYTIKNGKVPEAIKEKREAEISPKKILVLNHYMHKYYSLILVSAC